MSNIEKNLQKEEFDITVQSCDPDDCLHDCLVDENTCNAIVTGWW